MEERLIWTIHVADVVEWAEQYDGPPFHAVLTDPPYGLEFMGKEWDKLGAGVEETRDSAGGFLRDGKSGSNPYAAARVRHGKTDGFRRRQNPNDVGRDNVFGRTSRRAPEYSAGEQMEIWHYRWAAAIRKLCLPGAMMMAFGGTRTHHRLMCAIEDAGWEIRNTVCWLYGSGFPKSHNVSKAIDQAAGVDSIPTGEVHMMHTPTEGGNYDDDGYDWGDKYQPITRPATPEAQDWDGYGTALKPAWEPICLAMNPLDGTFAHNALTHGVAGLNVDGGRIGVSSDDPNHRVPSNTQWKEAKNCYGDGLSGRPVENLKSQGRWPSNLILSHHPSCVWVGERRVRGSQLGQVIERSRSSSQSIGKQTNGYCEGYTDPDGCETMEAWDCHPECPIFLLDQQSGERPVSGCAKSGRPSAVKSESIFGQRLQGMLHNDSGGASRFFQHCNWGEDDVRFLYQAKASNAERNAGLDGIEERQRDLSRNPSQPSMNDGEGNPYNRGCKPVRNDHPTVKPIALARYLATLLLPPPCSAPRRILIPFSGSGSEAIGALLAGWEEIVLIDLDPHYCDIAKRRLKFWQPWAGTALDPSDILAEQAPIRRREQAEAKAGVTQLSMMSLLEDS